MNKNESPAARILALLAAQAGDRAAALAMLRPAPVSTRPGYLCGSMVCTGRERGRKVWAL